MTPSEPGLLLSFTPRSCLFLHPQRHTHSRTGKAKDSRESCRGGGTPMGVQPQGQTEDPG